MNLFDMGKEQFKITKPVRLIELFAGIGAQAKALENLGVDFEPWVVCEFDKYAIASYNAIHGTNFETSDICELKGADLNITDKDKYCYIMTYSFPCQDLSLIGNRKGMSRDSDTRSGLLWQVERLLKECDELPDVLLMENVPEVHGSKNKRDFHEWVSFLESLGYSNYLEDLNAKDYGIPQSRNRAFMISLLEGYYEFPEPIPLELRLQDMLEDRVDEKYYLKGEAIDKFLYEIKERLHTHTHTGEISEQHQSKPGNVEIGKSCVKRWGNFNGKFASLDYRYDEGFRIRADNCCPTLCTLQSRENPETYSGQPLILCEYEN